MTAPAEKAAPIPALLPCPFCGVDGSIEEGLPGHFMAICLSCYCNVGENVETATGAAKHMFESADEAAEAWNRRADRASQEERIREDERDRLYGKANADYIEAEERGDAIAQDLHSPAAFWLGENGGMPAEQRARLRGGAS